MGSPSMKNAPIHEWEYSTGRVQQLPRPLPIYGSGLLQPYIFHYGTGHNIYEDGDSESNCLNVAALYLLSQKRLKVWNRDEERESSKR